MEAQEVLRALEALGARLLVDEGGRLGVQPASQLTDELRAACRAHRDELRELVRAAAPPEAAVDNWLRWARGEWDSFERLAGDFEDQGMPKDEAVALARQRVAAAHAERVRNGKPTPPPDPAFAVRPWDGAPAPSSPGELPELADAPLIEVREQLGAVLIRSPRFGEVWVVLEPSMAPELAAEEAGRAEPRPVLLAEDVARLRLKSAEMIRAALTVLATFPGARLIQ
jgi:hypothetical protein